MTKTLEQAIGCWTVTREYNSLVVLAEGVLASAKGCRRATVRGNVDKLVSELIILRKRLDATLELTNSALVRLDQILTTGELESPSTL